MGIGATDPKAHKSSDERWIQKYRQVFLLPNRKIPKKAKGHSSTRLASFFLLNNYVKFIFNQRIIAL